MSKINLTKDDVVSMNAETSLTNSPTSTADELMEVIKEYMRVDDEVAKNWISKGIECKVLQAQGGGWKKGRVRVRLEFIPDNPPAKPKDSNSPLADLRTNLDI